jgi:hypothetical protein
VTARKRDPYSQRLTDLENWLLLPANRALLTDSCKANKARPDQAAALLRVLVSKTNTHSGTVDQTIAQLSAVTLLPDYTVKRILKALTDIGVLVTVTGSRSGGAGGAAGRAPVRRVAFLSPVDIAGMAAHQTGNGGALEPNGGAPECAPLRFNSTEITPTAEKLEGGIQTDQPEQVRSQSMSQQSEQVISAVADRLVLQAAQSGLQLTSPDGFKQHQRSKARSGWNKAERRFGAGIRMITPAQYEYSLLLDWCAAVASDQTPSPATYQQLEAACKT